MNLRCYLFGHDAYEHGDTIERCARCHETVDWYYDEDWTFQERYGVLYSMRCFVGSIRDRLFPRCWNCGKLLWFGRMEGTMLCSQECAEESIPF